VNRYIQRIRSGTGPHSVREDQKQGCTTREKAARVSSTGGALASHLAVLQQGAKLGPWAYPETAGKGAEMKAVMQV